MASAPASRQGWLPNVPDPVTRRWQRSGRQRLGGCGQLDVGTGCHQQLPDQRFGVLVVAFPELDVAEGAVGVDEIRGEPMDTDDLLAFGPPEVDTGPPDGYR